MDLSDYVIGVDACRDATTIPCATAEAFSKSPDDYVAWEAAHRVAIDTINGWRVSTVFLAYDHRFWGNGPPILWETMVFAPDGDVPEDGTVQVRYCSRAEALEGHAARVAALKARFAPPPEPTPVRIEMAITRSVRAFE